MSAGALHSGCIPIHPSNRRLSGPFAHPPPLSACYTFLAMSTGVLQCFMMYCDTEPMKNSRIGPFKEREGREGV